MRNPVSAPVIALLAVLAFSAVLLAQPARPQTPQAQPGSKLKIAAPLSSMFFLAPARNREVPRMPQPAGPAPKHDLNGAWVGPLKASHGEVPPMTTVGQARFKLNKPEAVVHLAATNDPFVNCDPLGFPRNVLNHPVINAGMWLEQVPNRMVMLYQYQRVWRDIWMDGRELPKKVDAKGARIQGFTDIRWATGTGITRW